MFLVVLFVASLFLPLITHAERFCFQPPGPGGQECRDFPNGLTGCQAAAGGQASSCVPQPAVDNSSWYDGLASKIGSFIQTAIEGLLSLFLWIPVFISSLFLYVTANLFDYLIDHTIVGFAQLYTELFAIGVDTAWSAFRDVGNIVMIGMFVFVAFAVILNSQTYGLKQFGVRILIVAVLINFSLFFTKSLIDLSNFTASQFRKEIVTTGPDGAEGGIAAVFVQRGGLGSGFTGSLGTDGVAGLAGTAISNTVSSAFNKNGAVWTYVITATLFFTVAGAIFLFASILLLTRVITFLILMIMSPLAFVAYMTPNMEKWWTQWWSILIKNVIFAPVFLMLIWAVVLITGGIDGKESLFTQAIEGGVETTAVGGILNTKAYLNLAIVLGLLYASTKVASELSIMGAGYAKNFSVKRLGNVLTTSLAGMGFAANLGGRLPLLNRARDRVRQAGDAARDLGQRQGFGPGFDKAMKRVASSSLQIGDSKLSKALEKATGVKGAQIGLKSASLDDQAAYEAERFNKGYGQLAKEAESELKAAQGGEASGSSNNSKDIDKLAKTNAESAKAIKETLESTAAERSKDIDKHGEAAGSDAAYLTEISQQNTPETPTANAGQQEQISIAKGDNQIKEVAERTREAARLRAIEDGVDESIPTAVARDVGTARGVAQFKQADGLKGLQNAIKNASEQQKNRDFLGLKKGAAESKATLQALKTAQKGVQERAVDKIYGGGSSYMQDMAKRIKKNLNTEDLTSSDLIAGLEKKIDKLDKGDSA